MIVKPRTKDQLKLMQVSGQISAYALKRALETAKAGVDLHQIEKVAAEEIEKRGAKLSFVTAPGYKWATCLTINDELVHGIPRDIVLKEGDILSVDVGAMYQGWHTDTAWSIIIGGKPTKFLAIGEEALWKGIAEAKKGNTIGDISEAIQTTIEGVGYDVSKQLIGHGVGEYLHEPPDVPGFGKKGIGMVLEENMTLAIEAIYAEGSAEVDLASDGWTYVTRDHSLGGLFEMTVVVKEGKPEVLTDFRKL